jgi:ribosome-associated protein
MTAPAAKAVSKATPIWITGTLAIDPAEIHESFIRAAGPGGQHVNTTSSAVQLRFDVRHSPSLPYDVRVRLEVELVRAAAKPPLKRKPTRPTKASKRRRVDDKKRHGAIKSLRRSRPDD